MKCLLVSAALVLGLALANADDHDYHHKDYKYVDKHDYKYDHDDYPRKYTHTHDKYHHDKYPHDYKHHDKYHHDYKHHDKYYDHHDKHHHGKYHHDDKYHHVHKHHVDKHDKHHDYKCKGDNEIWAPCAPCLNEQACYPKEHYVCSLKCVSGCTCIKGYKRNHLGRCIPEAHCKKYHH